ncbi:MAG: hypothetical protein HC789_00185 [Microcoleus sp. CSU_2_2]|nr:hypothetical protein [Microcoleus sp. SU_5_3]NJS08887.1 hypothetical protein [Microcoleus sp. CSU_2_2]
MKVEASQQKSEFSTATAISILASITLLSFDIQHQIAFNPHTIDRRNDKAHNYVFAQD